MKLLDRRRPQEAEADRAMLAFDHMVEPVGLDDPFEIGRSRHDPVRQAADDPVVKAEIDRAISGDACTDGTGLRPPSPRARPATAG